MDLLKFVKFQYFEACFFVPYCILLPDKNIPLDEGTLDKRLEPLCLELQCGVRFPKRGKNDLTVIGY
jgi:hypothetical protein